MITYIVTKEIKTSWWKKLLRFLSLIKPREEFEICFSYNKFNVGEVLSNGDCDIRLISAKKQ